MKRVLDSDSEPEPATPAAEHSFPVTLHLNGKRPRADPGAAPEPKNTGDESEEFELSPASASSESEDEFGQDEERRQMRRFVVRSDAESEEDDEPPSPPPRRRLRSHNAHVAPLRTSRRLAGGNEYGSVVRELSSEDELKAELRAELRDLRSPSPVVRELRQRERVNYRILAPPPPEVAPTKDGKPGKRLSDRRLFSVAGPFGGHDVVSVFKPRRQHLERTLAELKQQAETGSNAVYKKDDSDPLGIETDIDFSSIGGLQDYVGQLKEMVTLPLQYPELYKRFGITPPRGVLFHGPPGTGKTLMARALAAMGSREGGKKITFFMRKGGDCLSKWVGEAERQLRVLFDEAKEKQPSIIFFDEIDGLAPVRSSQRDQTHASIVSTLLALMDGLDNRGQVVIIGATNRPDNIDPALRRPGRFDREFYFPLPNLDARKQIVQIHTKKWDPPLEAEFIGEIAEHTKGYGGADIKALCTESALNAIQRSYPQIYASDKKLVVHPESISVTPGDVLKALERILPSTVRGTSSQNAALPGRVVPLLASSFEAIKARLDTLMPQQRSLSALEMAQYTSNLSFVAQRRLDEFKSARVNRPRLLVHGEPGSGQEYIASAILGYLEGVTSHVLDLASLFSDPMRTPEAAIVQTLSEARKRSPSVVLIPNIELWYQTVPPQALSVFMNALRTFAPTDKVLIVGVSNEPLAGLEAEVKRLFGLGHVQLKIETTPSALDGFFGPLFDFIRAPPTETADVSDRTPRALPALPEAQEEKQTNKTQTQTQGSSEKLDNRTRSQLKVKLGSLMDLFQKRYRRFKKPVVDDDDLLHLFVDTPGHQGEYVRTDDDRILELSTGKTYHNMDLDVVEDRLWNGYYCEPRQFLQDLELIHEDSLVLGDRDRVHKSSEMVANAQVAIDEIDSAFIEACRDLHKRETERELREFDDDDEPLEPLRPLAEPLGEPQGEQRAELPEASEPADSYSKGPFEPSEHTEHTEHSQLAEGESAAEGAAQSPEPSSRDPVASPMVIEETSFTQEPPAAEAPHPAFSVPPLDEFKARLYTLCAPLNLDSLETAFSLLADVAWDYRLDWDREAMVHRLEASLDGISDIL